VSKKYVDKLRNKARTFLDISLFRITPPVLSVVLDICRLHVMPDDSYNAKEM